MMAVPCKVHDPKSFQLIETGVEGGWTFFGRPLETEFRAYCPTCNRTWVVPR